MATYRDPGTTLTERLVPGSVSINSQPKTLCVIGCGSRTKQKKNAAVTRGAVTGETVTFVGRTASLLNRADRRMSNTRLYKDGVELDQASYGFTTPYIKGVAGPFDMTTNNVISIALDGLPAIVISFVNGGSDSVSTMSGNRIVATVTDSIDSVSAAKVAAAINMALAAAGALGYGTAYDGVATVDNGAVKVASPSTGSNASVEVLTPFPASSSATLLVFGDTEAVSDTQVEISAEAYDAESTYTIDYVAVDLASDDLGEANIVRVDRVGSYANVSSYVETRDWSLSSDTLEWKDGTPAELRGVAASGGTFDVTGQYRLRISLDSRPSIDVYLNMAPGTPPAGYAAPTSASAATPSELANNINAYLAASVHYGPKYKAVASVDGGNRIVLTSPTNGVSSSITLSVPSASSALEVLFGLTGSHDVYGSGAQPRPGAVYFATFTYTRPQAEYNTPFRFFDEDSAIDHVGPETASNPLATAVKIAFENDVPVLYVVQVDDSGTPLAPTRSQVKDAIDASASKSDITDIVVLSTNQQVMLDQLQHIVEQSSPDEGNFRRMWTGPARDTPIGDADTPGTHIYLAKRTLQVPPDSPGRGRITVVGPTNVSRTIRLPSGAEVKKQLDGSFVAVAQAAQFCSLATSESALNKQIYGFDVDDFQDYKPGERRALAGAGVSVIRVDGGRLITHDPTTTERAGGGMISFEDPAQIAQRDAVSRAVKQVVDANLVGITPHDLADFIYSIKIFVGRTIESMIEKGEIAPYRNADGSTRALDYNRDIQAMQSPSNPKAFSFKYWFNLKYVARNMDGEFSVDSPFFVS